MTIVAGLDIGSSYIRVLIAQKTEQGFTQLGGAIVPSSGIVSGQITAFDAAADAISTAIHRAESAAQQHIDNLIISVNRSKAISHQTQHQIKIPSTQITQDDVRRLISEAKANIALKPDRQILHLNPIGFYIDGKLESKNPVNLHSNSLSIKMHCLSVDATAVKNIDAALAYCKIKAHRKVFAPYAAAQSVLTPAESEIGAIVLDFGDQTIGISIIRQHALQFAASLPFGINTVQNDIARTLGINSKESYRLMSRHGNALMAPKDANNFITYYLAGDDPSNHQHQQSASQLNKVINGRVKALLEEIEKKLNNAGYDHLHLWHFVLTGGGANLEGLHMVATEHFKAQVRNGKPQGVSGVLEGFKLPQGACVMGLVQHYNFHALQPKFLSAAVKPKRENIDGRTGYHYQLLNWFKRCF
ncbi:MAG: cell division protein FtsA [Alphaproteobacteria bacterium]